MMFKRRSLLTFLGLILITLTAGARDSNWPRTVSLDEGTVTVYAPQLEAMNEGVLYYRAALAYRADAKAEPVFGAGWLKSDVVIDESNNLVSPDGMSLTQTRFPEGTTDIEAELATALSRQSRQWDLDFTVAELNAALDAAEAETLASRNLKTAPPEIYYRDQPALLVTIDGKPILREIEDSPYEAVINTTFPLITDGKTYYLNAAKDAWYRAQRATGPYEFDNNPPQDLVAMVASSKEASGNTETDQSGEKITAQNAPEIVISTKPAELIVTDGPADFAPLVDDLLVLKNSADDVFMHVGEQKYYIVLAGRWYQSASLDGPWSNHSADALPAAFAKIPDDSAQADSRVYVAGTPEAEEAILDAHVPQTAAVQRGEVDIEVEYDGRPDFSAVEGTEDLYYAENTGATVLESDRSYYLLEDGVWYISDSAHGPWVVSDHRPGELESVEPSSPVYNTKYVHVYDSTPEVVYVGYTPGYVGSYVYGPTLVYGTGYYYRPWISRAYYYPRASTWGFSVGYSSYSGWSFGIGWNYGGWNLNYYTGGYWHYNRPWYNRYYGYWGPRGYCPTPYYGGYGAYNPYGRQYAYNRGYRNGYRDGYGDGQYYDDGDSHQARNRNLYSDTAQQAQVIQTRDSFVRRPDTSANPVREQFESSDRRIVNNQKIRESRTGQVSQTEIRNKARMRDSNRTAGLEPRVATTNREIRRAVSQTSGDRSQVISQQTGKQKKIRQNRTGPVSRTEIRQRGQMIAKQPSSATEPARNVTTRKQVRHQADNKRRESRQQVIKPSHNVTARMVDPQNQRSQKQTRSSSRVISDSRDFRQRGISSRPVEQRSRSAGNQTRQKQRRTAAPAQQVARPSNRQINRAPSRPQPQVRQRAPRPAVSQKQRVSKTQPVQRPQVRQAPRSANRKSAAPQRQARNASRPQGRGAPAPRAQQRAKPARIQTPGRNPREKRQ